MFYYLEGNVALMEPNIAVIDVAGAGYKCFVTTNTMSRLELGKKARLYTFCNIKEDTFDIYGFFDTGEKRCFEMLLSVSGVGPKAALSILSSVTPENLAMAIITENDKALTGAPGIGKRIAQRIILELKDKVSKETDSLRKDGFAVPVSGVGAAGTKLAEASAGLAVLGYAPAEITAAMRSVDVEALSVEEIIRQVLKNSVK